MDGNGGGPNENARLDRIEGIVEALADSQVRLIDSQKQLLTAQVVLTDRVDRLAQELSRLAEHTTAALDRLAEAQRHTDEKLNTLIETVDDLVRRTSPPQQS